MDDLTFIEVYPNVLDSATCELIINTIDQACNTEAVTSTATEDRYDDSISAKEDNYEFYHTIRDAVLPYWTDYSKKYEVVVSGNKARFFYPVIKLQRSPPGGGFRRWHKEQSPGSPTRFAVWMIYLNTVTKGGCTDFKFQNVSCQPVQGTLVIWPAAFTHLHRSSPNLKQTKYIATGWFAY